MVRLALISILLLVINSSFGQETIRLNGVLYDSDGQTLPIKDLVVKIDDNTNTVIELKTDNNGLFEVVYTIDNVTSTSETLLRDNSVKTYGNGNYTDFNISAHSYSQIESYEFQILNSAGKFIGIPLIEKSTFDLHIYFDAFNFPNGIYYLKGKINHEEITQKLVKNTSKKLGNLGLRLPEISTEHQGNSGGRMASDQVEFTFEVQGQYPSYSNLQQSEFFSAGEYQIEINLPEWPVYETTLEVRANNQFGDNLQNLLVKEGDRVFRTNEDGLASVSISRFGKEFDPLEPEDTIVNLSIYSDELTGTIIGPKQIDPFAIDKSISNDIENISLEFETNVSQSYSLSSIVSFVIGDAYAADNHDIVIDGQAFKSDANGSVVINNTLDVNPITDRPVSKTYLVEYRANENSLVRGKPGSTEIEIGLGSFKVDVFLDSLTKYFGEAEVNFSLPINDYAFITDNYSFEITDGISFVSGLPIGTSLDDEPIEKSYSFNLLAQDEVGICLEDLTSFPVLIGPEVQDIEVELTPKTPLFFNLKIIADERVEGIKYIVSDTEDDSRIFEGSSDRDGVATIPVGLRYNDICRAVATTFKVEVYPLDAVKPIEDVSPFEVTVSRNTDYQLDVELSNAVNISVLTSIPINNAKILLFNTTTSKRYTEFTDINGVASFKRVDLSSSSGPQDYIVLISDTEASLCIEPLPDNTRITVDPNIQEYIIPVAETQVTTQSINLISNYTTAGISFFLERENNSLERYGIITDENGVVTINCIELNANNKFAVRAFPSEANLCLETIEQTIEIIQGQSDYYFDFQSPPAPQVVLDLQSDISSENFSFELTEKNNPQNKIEVQANNNGDAQFLLTIGLDGKCNPISTSYLVNIIDSNASKPIELIGPQEILVDENINVAAQLKYKENTNVTLTSSEQIAGISFTLKASDTTYTAITNNDGVAFFSNVILEENGNPKQYFLKADFGGASGCFSQAFLPLEIFASHTNREFPVEIRSFDLFPP